LDGTDGVDSGLLDDPMDLENLESGCEGTQTQKAIDEAEHHCQQSSNAIGIWSERVCMIILYVVSFFGSIADDLWLSSRFDLNSGRSQQFVTHSAVESNPLYIVSEEHSFYTIGNGEPDWITTNNRPLFSRARTRMFSSGIHQDVMRLCEILDIHNVNGELRHVVIIKYSNLLKAKRHRIPIKYDEQEMTIWAPMGDEEDPILLWP
jgi:hypothetical protein